MKSFDILVIGAGAGTKLVTPPSLLGKRVAVFEKESPGGTCLNRGCIPSKMLIYPSELLRVPEHSEKFPIYFSEKPKANFPKIVKRISDTVDADSQSIPIAYQKNENIEYIPGHAKFISNSQISCLGEVYTAPLIIVATGSRPKIPDIPGLAGTPYWTSREALRSDDLPKSLVVLGGGFIGLELGAAYAAYGTDVKCYTRSSILQGQDEELKKEFLDHPPFSIQENTQLKKVSFKENKFHLEFEHSSGQKSIEISEKLLISTGIQPNTEDLGLEHTTIRRDPGNYILVDNHLETHAPGVYAFGDCIGRFFYRHSANFEGEYLFENLIAKPESKKPIQYPPMPCAVFTHPQIASVGETEERLVKNSVSYWKGVNRYSSSAMGMARMSEIGFVKLLFDANTETLLGAHIIGDEASNLIQMFVLGMSLNLKLDDYLNQVFIHPALPEVSRNALRKVREQRNKR